MGLFNRIVRLTLCSNDLSDVFKYCRLMMMFITMTPIVYILNALFLSFTLLSVNIFLFDSIIILISRLYHCCGFILLGFIVFVLCLGSLCLSYVAFIYIS